MSLVKTLYPKGLAMCLQFSMYIVLVILLKCDYFAKFTILYLVNLFCLNQDVQDLRMYRMFFLYSSTSSEIAIILISQNIKIKYYPVDPLIL